MLRFLLRRLLVAIPTLFLVVTASFFMMRAAPGNPFSSSASVTKLGAGFDYALTNNITIGVGISATQVRPNWP